MENLNDRLAEIAMRIRVMREILEIPVEEMARITQTTEEEYLAHEQGDRDFSFTFLLHCASAFGIDMVELITGTPPKLSYYTVVRKGQGLPIKRRKNLNYEHLAFRMKNKLAEPFLVTAPYEEDAQQQPIPLSRHTGQEFDYILEGRLRVQIEDHVEELGPGDAIYYDSRFGHGMIAIGGQPCKFIAVVIKETDPSKPQESRED
ncbi:MAG TPA: cupin domain-containing protein [Clostridiales bacterium]|nr:cupin domain-containing protein [Clostridiales bacterium]